MTTDLTGDFELGEDQLEWDVFVPDPDDAEIAAEAAALEDEDELHLDDSAFDWDSALREDSEPEGDAESGARAGAAYDRIVDMVRPSFEEPELVLEPEPEPELVLEPEPEPELVLEPEPEPELVLEPDADWEPVTVLSVETAAATESAAAVEELATAHDEWEPPADLHRFADLDLEEEIESVGPAWTMEPGAAAAVPETEPEPRPTALFVTATNEGPEAAFEEDEDPDPEPDAGPLPDFEPAEARIAMLAATVAAMAPPQTPPDELFGSEPDIAPDAAPQWEEGGVTTPAGSPIPRRTHRSRARKQRERSERNERSRVFTATVVLACLALVVIAAAASVSALRHPTAVATTGYAPVHASASASDTARIQAATDALDSATTSASVALSSLATFPTPSNVEKIINSYISSLQLYGTFLSGSAVPASARSDATSAETQVRQDLQFLDTIDSLPPLQLGAFLKQFDIDATQLQTTLSALEQNLRAAAS